MTAFRLCRLDVSSIVCFVYESRRTVPDDDDRDDGDDVDGIIDDIAVVAARIPTRRSGSHTLTTPFGKVENFIFSAARHTSTTIGPRRETTAASV